MTPQKNSPLAEINSMVEKPNVSEAPSDIAIIGRYILPPAIFNEIERLPPGALGEIQLTDALSGLLSTHSCLGFLFPGHHFDVGTPTGLLKAATYLALKKDEIRPQFTEWLREELDVKRKAYNTPNTTNIQRNTLANRILSSKKISSGRSPNPFDLTND